MRSAPWCVLPPATHQAVAQEEISRAILEQGIHNSGNKSLIVQRSFKSTEQKDLGNVHTSVNEQYTFCNAEDFFGTPPPENINRKNLNG
jgi:hypothetical protein